MNKLKDRYRTVNKVAVSRAAITVIVTVVAATLVGSIADSPALLAATISLGMLAVPLTYFQARSEQRYLRAIHAETRRSKKDRAELSARLTNLEDAVRASAELKDDIRKSLDELGSRAARWTSGTLEESGPSTSSRAPQRVIKSATPERRVTRKIGDRWHVNLVDGVAGSELVPIRGEPLEVNFPVDGPARLLLETELRSASSKPDTNAATLQATFRDGTGRKIALGDKPVLKLQYAPGMPNSITLEVPTETKQAKISVGRASSSADYSLVNRVEIRAIEAPNADARGPEDVRVAFVADEFTYNSFRYECDAIALHPDSWRAQFEEHRPELFFCESAWAGVTSEREWRGRVYASNAWATENRSVLIEILDYCRRQGIPTVFWNKEDPSHYYDRRHNFVKTALMFDHILSTDEVCVERYRQEWGAESVGVLPFAAQPKLYNPAGSGRERENGVIFAGSWYANHAERSSAMQIIFDSILDEGLELVVLDRYFGETDPNHLYPEKYRPLTRPAVPHASLARTYKQYEFGLNFNTETASSTMFARRVFELAATGTLVVSNYSRGVERFFGEDVIFPGRSPGRIRDLSAAERAGMRNRATENVLQNHTYRARFQQVLDMVGIVVNPIEGQDSFISRVRSFDRAKELVSRHRALQTSSGLIMIVDGAVESSTVQSYYREFMGDRVSVVASEFSTEVLRRASMQGALVQVEDNFPSVSEISRAQLHRQYASDPIAIVGEREYEYGPIDSATPILLPKAAPDDLVGSMPIDRAYKI